MLSARHHAFAAHALRPRPGGGGIRNPTARRLWSGWGRREHKIDRKCPASILRSRLSQIRCGLWERRPRPPFRAGSRPCAPGISPSLAARRGFRPGMTSIPGDSGDGGTSSSIPGVVAMQESTMLKQVRRAGMPRLSAAPAAPLEDVASRRDWGLASLRYCRDVSPPTIVWPFWTMGRHGPVHSPWAFSSSGLSE